MSHKIVLIGAGSANFGLGVMGDLLRSEVFAGSTICLHDINAAALARTEAFGRHHIEARNLPYTLAATTDRKTALQGADFCIISIEVGNRFELWEQDWHIPQQYGIRQVYGENGGPGGLFHSLRIIPPILDICGDIMAICPDAWVLNFSNPMSRICTTVMRKYPDLKLVGICHEVASLPAHLPNILGTPLDNLRFQAGGLNHFSVLLNIHYKDTGADAYPDVRAKAPAYFEQITNVLGWALPSMPPEHVATVGHRPWAERQLFKVILERFGYLPITVDSHFGEYIQWAWDVADSEGILDFLPHLQDLGGAEGLSGDADQRFRRRLGDVGNPGEHCGRAPGRGAGRQPAQPRLSSTTCPPISPWRSRRWSMAAACMAWRWGASRAASPACCATRSPSTISPPKPCSTSPRRAALQALLVDPVVHSVSAAEQTLAMMLRVQQRWLGYLE